MGFCLFEHLEDPGVFFAVNPAYVKNVVEEKGSRITSLLELSVELDNRELRVPATKKQVQKVLAQGATIGLNSAQIHVLIGRPPRPQPLQINKPGTIILIYEILDYEFPQEDESFVTASCMYVQGERQRLIVERPGAFAKQVNAETKVPMIGK